jgi:tetratricopeptide (TPR) repeat protein
MGWRKLTLISLCLIITALPAWADQNLLIKGIEAQKAGQHEQAVKLLRQYLKLYPQMAEVRAPLAESLAALGRNQEALKEVDKGLAQRPDNLKLLLAKAELLMGLDRRSEAIKILNRTHKCYPKPWPTSTGRPNWPPKIPGSTISGAWYISARGITTRRWPIFPSPSGWPPIPPTPISSGAICTATIWGSGIRPLPTIRRAAPWDILFAVMNWSCSE